MAFNNSYYGGQYLYPQQSYRYKPQVNNQQANFSLKGRPVGSIDEARASMIDFDGTTFYFPDLAKKCIYTKKINLDGTSSLETYQLVETPAPASVATGDYVTNDVFNKTIQELVNRIESMKGATNNDAKQPNEQFSF